MINLRRVAVAAGLMLTLFMACVSLPAGLVVESAEQHGAIFSYVYGMARAMSGSNALDQVLVQNLIVVSILPLILIFVAYGLFEFCYRWMMPICQKDSAIKAALRVLLILVFASAVASTFFISEGHECRVCTSESPYANIIFRVIEVWALAILVDIAIVINIDLVNRYKKQT